MRVPAATARRIASTAARMSPSRNGSCSGSSAARNARAASASPYPRRTSTAARTSLTPSSEASASTSARSHPFRSCHDMGSSRYGGPRTELLARQVQTEQRENGDQADDAGGDPGHEPRPPATSEGHPADLRPQNEDRRGGAEGDDDHRCQQGGPLERDLERPHD